MEILGEALQIIVAIGLINVWLVRVSKSTPYRGGDANSMRGEFEAYGLPVAMMYVVGALKILIAVAMIAGLWLPTLIVPAASVLVILMLGAFLMHLKVKDPIQRSLPAMLMLAMAIAIITISRL